MNDSPHDVEPLIAFLQRVPSVNSPVLGGVWQSNCWWVKFSLDITHPLAWNAVQGMGHALNHHFLDDRLPVGFIPVSAPPYLNGGPAKFLRWVIESTEAGFSPDNCAAWLQSRLPWPIEDEDQWKLRNKKQWNRSLDSLWSMSGDEEDGDFKAQSR